MDLRCKVFRGANAGDLESAINEFLSDGIAHEGEAQLEEITQSEGPGGVTITLWYSLVAAEDEILDDYDAAHSSGELA
jgi:hypothetical protein